MGSAQMSHLGPAFLLYKKYLPSKLQVKQHSSAVTGRTLRTSRRPVPSARISNQDQALSVPGCARTRIRSPPGETHVSPTFPGKEINLRGLEPSFSAIKTSLSFE